MKPLHEELNSSSSGTLEKSRSICQGKALIQKHVCICIQLRRSMGFPGGSVANNPAAMQEMWVQPGLGRSGVANGNSLQYFA